MKYATLVVLGLVTLTGCNKIHQGKNNLISDIKNQNHGEIKKNEIFGDFDEIEVSQSIEAEIIKSDVEKVVIEAPENIINDILVDRDKQKINIHYRSGIRVMNTSDIKAKIYAKDFEKIKASSAAVIVVKDKFTQDKTKIEASGASVVKGDFEANDLEVAISNSSTFEGKIWAVELDLEASSAANVSISGKAKIAEDTASSAASISAKDVLVDNLNVSSSSASSVEIGAVNNLEAEASSGGSLKIYKKGNLNILKKEESSGGSISIN